jgi:hypothetical protein
VTIPALLLLVGDALAGCAATDLGARLDEAEAAYAALLGADDEGAAWSSYEHAVDEARATLACTTDLVDGTTAARVHLLEGLARHAEGDDAEATAAWRAARRADPDVALGDWARDGDPELALWRAVQPDVSGGGALPAPAGLLRLDGLPGLPRPSASPVVWQETDRRGGRVRRTAYVWPDAPTPPYRRAAPKAAWAITGAGLGLLGGGLAVLGTSVAAWRTACDRPTGCDPALGLPGERVVGLVDVGIPVGAALAGVGLAAAVGGGAWIGVSSAPRSVGVVVTVRR